MFHFSRYKYALSRYCHVIDEDMKTGFHYLFIFCILTEEGVFHTSPK